MQRFCDEMEIEIETAHPAAADDDDISEEMLSWGSLGAPCGVPVRKTPGYQSRAYI